jgi:uncharacterized protein YndB with AHSA1/START domain
MARITVETVIERSIEHVWAALEQIESHTDWMADAESITFLTDQRSGVGTTFECLTKVGPISLTDVMEITAWEPQRRMGVRHDGIVTGWGEFTLTALGEHRTLFSWAEDLTFPLWLGGPVGEFFGRFVLRAIWKGNLRRLKAGLEH